MWMADRTTASGNANRFSDPSDSPTVFTGTGRMSGIGAVRSFELKSIAFSAPISERRDDLPIRIAASRGRVSMLHATYLT